jgi:hypothetical protein
MKPSLRFVIPLVAIGAYVLWSAWSYHRMRESSGSIAATSTDDGPRHLVYRPSTATFYVGPEQLHTIRLGRKGTHPVAGDFDGDGRNDLGIYDAGEWNLQPTGKSPSERITVRFGGVPGDVALNGADFDGDGRDELVLYRSGTWFVADVRAPARAPRQFQFGGLQGDLPTVWAGKAGPTLAIFRSGTWFVDEDRDGVSDAQWNYGAEGDRPVVVETAAGTLPSLYRDGLWLIDGDGDRNPDRSVVLGGRADIPLGAFLARAPAN